LVEPINEDFGFDALGDNIVYTGVACCVSFFRLLVLANPDSPRGGQTYQRGRTECMIPWKRFSGSTVKFESASANI
jgi:hypothetical protein